MKNALLPYLLCFGTCLPASAQSAQVRPVAAFHAISVGTGIELTLTAGASQRVEVSAATTDYRDRIETTVQDGVLTLRYKRPDDSAHRNERMNTYLRVAVTADQLTALTAGSGAAVVAKGDFDAADFRLAVLSGASVKADITTTAPSVHQSSGSIVSLAGRAASLTLEAGSGATFNGKGLQTDHCRAQASSGSAVRVAVKDDLVADASSGASISYSGSPQVTKHVSSGASVSGH